MATIELKKEYSCHNDCKMMGCPKHTATLIFHSVSDSYTYSDGKGKEYYFNHGELQSLVDLLKSLDRADKVRI